MTRPDLVADVLDQPRVLPGAPAPRRSPAHRPWTAPASAPSHQLSFHGLTIAVHGAVPDLVFQFGPHVVHRGRADLSVEILTGQPDPAGGPVVRQVCVRQADGLPLLRRPLRGWTNVPPPIPPFAAMTDRLWLAPAVVLTNGRATVALFGSVSSPKAEIAMALADRAWRFVATQFLVLERRTGQAVPHLVPLEVWDPVVGAALRASLPRESWRATRSALGGEVLLVRPEAVGTVERLDARAARPHLLGLCRGPGSEITMAVRDFPVQGWPAGRPAPLAGLRKVVVQLPEGSVADEAAQRIDDAFTRTS